MRPRGWEDDASGEKVAGAEWETTGVGMVSQPRRARGRARGTMGGPGTECRVWAVREATQENWGDDRPRRTAAAWCMSEDGMTTGVDDVGAELSWGGGRRQQWELEEGPGTRRRWGRSVGSDANEARGRTPRGRVAAKAAHHSLFARRPPLEWPFFSTSATATFLPCRRNAINRFVFPLTFAVTVAWKCHDK